MGPHTGPTSAPAGCRTDLQRTVRCTLPRPCPPPRRTGPPHSRCTTRTRPHCTCRLHTDSPWGIRTPPDTHAPRCTLRCTDCWWYPRRRTAQRRMGPHTGPTSAPAGYRTDLQRTVRCTLPRPCPLPRRTDPPHSQCTTRTRPHCTCRLHTESPWGTLTPPDRHAPRCTLRCTDCLWRPASRIVQHRMARCKPSRQVRWRRQTGRQGTTRTTQFQHLKTTPHRTAQVCCL